MADNEPTEPQSPTPPRHMVTTGVAARYCGVSVKVIRRWIHAGYLPAFRVGPGQTIRVDMNDVETMLRPVVAP